MSLSRFKQITLKELYLKYSYKKNLITPLNTIPDPYVKQQDISDHKHTMDYDEWRVFMEDYINLVGEVLIAGNEFKLPYFMGLLRIKKIKCRKFFDRVKSKNNVPFYSNRGNYENYVLRLKWDRGYFVSKLTFKWHWKIDINLNLLKKAYNKCDEDYTYINNFVDL